MKKIGSLLAIAGLTIVSNTQAQFASSVVSYTQGTGANSSYNNPDAALGAPTTDIGYQNADPFNAPYLPSDIVGLGAGGSLTLQFASPIINNPANPYGVDFIVFGHAGFNIVNGNYSGGGITDGSLYQGGVGVVNVSVSMDGTTYYPLIAPSSVSAQVDGLFPTDASGNPFLPVNPVLTAASFAGQDLAGIRSLYAGSAGGTGFDLSWAGVSLSSVDYVRFEVVSGSAYIDAVSEVQPVPEPASWAFIPIVGLLFSIYPRNKR
jgi:hypothetical protein